MKFKEAVAIIGTREIDFLMRDKSGKGFVCPICQNGSKGGHKQGTVGYGVNSSKNGQTHKVRVKQQGRGLYEITDSTNEYYKPGKHIYHCYECNGHGDTLDWWLAKEGIVDSLEKGTPRPTSEKFVEGVRSYCDYAGIILEADAPTEQPDTWQPIPPKQTNIQNESVEIEIEQRPAWYIDYTIDSEGKPVYSEKILKYLAGRGFGEMDVEILEHAKVFPAVVFHRDSPDWKQEALVKSNIFGGQDIICVDENFKSKNGKAGQSWCGVDINKQYIFVVEGLLDALSVNACGFPSYSLNSINNIRKFAEMLDKEQRTGKKNFKDKTIIISLDNDPEGVKCQEQHRDLLEGTGFDIYFANICAGTDHKDANEYFVANKDACRESIEKIIYDIRKERLIANKDTFIYWFNNLYKKEKQMQDRKIDTGIPGINDILEGGLPVGLSVLGAISSLGKTTLLTQLAENMAHNDAQVLFFSLEQSRYQLFFKGMLRNKFRDAFPGKVEKLQNAQAFNNFLCGNYNIVEGFFDTTIESIKEKIAEVKTYAGKEQPFVVIIDYLQALALPTEQNLTDKMKADKIVKNLKILSMEQQCCILAVSTIGRQYYYKEIDKESFKESGNIEYTADILLGLDVKGVKEYKGLSSEKETERNAKIKSIIKKEIKKKEREVVVTCIKNRNGQPGKMCNLIFKTKYQAFVELDKEGKEKPLYKKEPEHSPLLADNDTEGVEQ